MVSTPKTPKNIITLSKMDPNDSNNNIKVNILSPHQDFGHYIDPMVPTESPPTKSEEFDPTFYQWVDLFSNDPFNAEAPVYDVSPLTSSMTTPSLILDGISTPQDLQDSPLFNSSFSASPPLEPALDFFPDLSTSSLMQIPIVPSVQIPVEPSMQIPAEPSMQIPAEPSIQIPIEDPSSPIIPIPVSSLSPALNIPWTTDGSDGIFQNVPSPLSAYTTINSPNSTSTIVSTTTSPSSSSPIKSTTPTIPSIPTIPTTRTRTARNKRSIGDIEKDAEEAALKRAKNTDAARRSRLRKLMKLETLKKQVVELETENNGFLTRIAVLESEKKGLEEKNAEKDVRVKMLEQQLADAHERLINRT